VTQGDASSGYALRARVRHIRQVRHRATLPLGEVMSRSSGEPTVWAPKLVLTRMMEASPNSATGVAERTDGVLKSLQSLEREDAVFLLMRVHSVPWKAICRHFSISRATANRRLGYLLTVIAWKLNGRVIPIRWSRRYLLDRERELSSDDPADCFECVRHIRVGQPSRAIRSIDQEGRIEHEDAAAPRRSGEPANCEVPAEDRKPVL
jgi:hypothetical protein